MAAESPQHVRIGGPLIVPSQPPTDYSIIDTVSGLINDITLSSNSHLDSKDVIKWARFETADINEPRPESDSDSDELPLLLILGYGSGIQVWYIRPNDAAEEVLSWRQGTVKVLKILPTPERNDCYTAKRPLIALCDSSSSAPTFCTLSFMSIKGGDQVKSVKFKNPILEILANKRSIVVSFPERFAVFDAATLEHRLAVSTCYPCPCPLGGSTPINPLALNERWLAYAEKKMNKSKRSNGGCEGEGVASYTATVLNAAKSLSKGLRGLGESVAQSLAGVRGTSQSPSPPHVDVQQPGVVTVLDIVGNVDEDFQDNDRPYEPIMAHFVAHSEAIIAMKFDHSGMLLITADRRGHDFHVFKINPHTCSPSLASVHHLYILHRGDTTARVQDIAIAPDSRWAAISTMRGTTHVFPMSPYGGPCSVRTHRQPRVVNRLSRFHRSAGLPIHAATGHTGSMAEDVTTRAWYPNPLQPPYPVPTTVYALTQLRSQYNLPTTITRTSSGRQRLTSLSEDSSSMPLLACSTFGYAQVASSGNATTSSRATLAQPLYLLSGNGKLMRLLLHPRVARNVPKEKICDDSPIELEVETVVEWLLQRPQKCADLLAPLPPSNPLMMSPNSRYTGDVHMSEEDRWLSQVEIVTYAGPHRRLWMGPQFVFKTYNSTGSNLSLSEAEIVEVDTSANRDVARSNPVNMPLAAGGRPLVPVIIDSGSASSLEHSPLDTYRRRPLLAERGRTASISDVQLREDLADAMKEDNGWTDRQPEAHHEARATRASIARYVDPQGTVVVSLETFNQFPEDSDDLDDYIISNADEATNRQVEHAPAPVPRHNDVFIPLPKETTIPVQTTSSIANFSPQEEPLPLKTNVIIPAELTKVQREWVSTDNENDNFVELHPSHFDDYHMITNFELHDVGAKEDSTLDIGNLVKDKNVKDLMGEYDVCKSANESGSVEIERECNDKITLPKLNQPSDDIQSTVKGRFKNAPTTKLTSNKVVNDLSARKNLHENTEVIKSKDNFKHNDSKNNNFENKKSKESKGAKEKIYIKESKESKSAKQREERKDTKLISNQNDEPQSNYDNDTSPYEVILAVGKSHQDSNQVGRSHNIEQKIIKAVDCDVVLQSDMKYIMKDMIPEQNNLNQLRKSDDVIKTEDQAWDLLLNDSENLQEVRSSLLFNCDDQNKKFKPKKSRKKDNFTCKQEEDGFVEIHAIESKYHSSEQFISFSCPLEGFESTSHSVQPKKSLLPENMSSQQSYNEKNNFERNVFNQTDQLPCRIQDKSVVKDLNEESVNISKINDLIVDKTAIGNEVKNLIENKASENTSQSEKIQVKHKKSKSLSPYTENRKTTKSHESLPKDVYVINTTVDQIPNIKVTEVKTHKKSESYVQDSEPVTKPVVSWSSVAAFKSSKQVDVNATKGSSIENIAKEELLKESFEEKHMSSRYLSLHEELVKVSKIKDIVVAECDAPSELNFVEEHHAVVRDTPTSGLGNPQVMRDSLIEDDEMKVISPLNNINIDDILNSSGEPASSTIGSDNMFQLVDLDRSPLEDKKQFSVKSRDLKTQEMQVNDMPNAKSVLMGKSSDEEPLLLTDSDKEDKNNYGAAETILAPSKQCCKSKKNRRKKK